jgi:hypothetical protein
MAALAAIPILSLSALAGDSREADSAKENKRDQSSTPGDRIDDGRMNFEELGADEICTVSEATALAA